MSNRIGCDVDGVIAQFNESFIELICKETGVDLFPPRPFDIPCWHYPQQYGYNNHDHLNKTWDTITQSETFWYNLNPYPEAKEVIAQLAGRALWGDDVYFITTRPSCGLVSAKAQTEMWLEAMIYDNLFVPTVLVTEKKGPIAAALDLTHFIDDKPENCEAVYQDSKAKVFMLNRSWNRDVSVSKGITRIDSVLTMLKELD